MKIHVVCHFKWWYYDCSLTEWKLSLLFNVVEIPSWNHLWYAFKTKHHRGFGFFFSRSFRFGFHLLLRASCACYALQIVHECISMKCCYIKYKTHFKHHKIIFRNKQKEYSLFYVIFCFSTYYRCAQCTVHHHHHFNVFKIDGELSSVGIYCNSLRA